MTRLVFFISVLAWGFYEASFPGIFYAFILFGITAFLWYCLTVAWNAVTKTFKRQPTVRIENKTLNMNVEKGNSIRGQRVDPTRPYEEWPAMIEQRRYRKGD